MTDILLCVVFAVSLVFAAFSGSIEPVASAMLTGAKTAVDTALTLCASMCLWCGIMNVARRAGLLETVTRLMRPVMRVIFPRVPRDSKAAGFICANIAANVLGLGSAATPLGISAIRELKAMSPNGSRATNDMCMMVVVNSASVQLIPSTVFALRAQTGSGDVFGIFLPALLSSVAALVVGVIFTKLCEGRR